MLHPLLGAAAKAHNWGVEHEAPVPDVCEPRRAPVPDAASTSSVFQGAETAMAVGADSEGTAPATYRPSVLIGLQRTAGNAAVAAMIQRRVDATGVQRRTSSVLDVVGRGRGQPLDPDLLAEMEGRLDDDFSDVRIHTDRDAADSAADVRAQAYTVGNEVVFGDGSPALDSPEGKRTLAHELTHVVQQRNGPVDGTPTGDGIAVSDPSDRFEQAAEANADRLMSGGEDHSSGGSGRSGVGGSAQRETTPEETGEEDDDDQPLQGIWLQREAAPDEIEDEEDEEHDADEPLQGIWLQRDDSGSSAPASDGQSPGAGDAQSDAAGSAPTADEFAAKFDTDAIISGVANMEGAGDLAPDQSGGSDGSSPPTAQAIWLQRDPPPGPPPGGPPAQSPDPTAPGPAPAHPGTVIDVAKALAAQPPFKAALDQLKAGAVADWKNIVAGTSPLEKTVAFTLTSAIALGAAAGALSNPSSRIWLIGAANGLQLPIPGVQGLSVTPITSGGQFRGGTINLELKF